MPRHELVDVGLRPAVDEAGQEIGEVALRIHAVELAGFDQGRDGRPVLTTLVAAGEQCVFAREGHRGCILPISSRMLRSITAGTRCTAARFGSSTPNGALTG